MSMFACLSNITLYIFLYTLHRWMSAYSAALSFRTSHYFVCYLSEVSATAAGIGHERREDGSYEWYRLHTPYRIRTSYSMP